MDTKLKKILRAACFVLAGALAGLAYYYFFGCSGSCAITSSPYRSMVWAAVLGALISIITEKEGGKCST